MKRVGVIGGGQLAWMMAAGAQHLGLELVVQTPNLDDPAVPIAQHIIQAAIADITGTQELAQHCDVITFENEFVDLAALATLAKAGVCFRPSLSALAPLLDKSDQRNCLRQLGLPTPDFALISLDSSPTELTQFGFPVVLKARRHGYDGRGTFILPNRAALQQVLIETAQAQADQSEPVEWLLETFVPFSKELAVIATRSVAGEVLLYPVVETEQHNQVCHHVFVGGQPDLGITRQVEAIATRLLTHLDFVGVMGIEFFLTDQGQVLVNEIAPRTHNSGHYTLEACHTSQFEQQLRAVCGLALADPGLKVPGAVMVSLLSFENAQQTYLSQRQHLADIPQATVYWYGKTASQVGRKLGHVTVLLAEGSPEQQRSQANALVQQIEAAWYPDGY